MDDTSDAQMDWQQKMIILAKSEKKRHPFGLICAFGTWKIWQVSQAAYQKSTVSQSKTKR